MRFALILAVSALAAACGDDTTGPSAAQPPGNSDGGIEQTDDPNAPCERECPEGSWCSYGRCVMP